MYYTVYQTTNLINNKLYIGTHITDYPNDEYLGSGKIISKAIKKYNPENFIKEILFVFDNPEDMFTKEKELVNEEWVSRKDTYNIKLGGEGGWDYVNSSGARLIGLKILNKNAAIYAVIGNAKVQELSSNNEWLMVRNQNIANGMLGKQNFKNHCHTEETIQQMKISHKGKHEGIKNSQYGTCWITNGKENKKIKKTELDKYINIGYTKGRIMGV